jgi:archaellum component FlaC
LERKNSESIAQKIKYLAEENRKKDMFLQNYLVGKKAEKEDIKEFFSKYEAEFPIGQIKSNMMRELKEIERLENRIKELEKK